MRRSLIHLSLAAALVAGAGTTALHATDSPTLVAEDGPGDKPCGEGTATMCGKITVYRCTDWKITSTQLGGTLSPGGGGVNAGNTSTCARWEQKETYLFKNP